ncbi:MAG: DUF1552 domain-containing protein [Myxococcaceae bacterium]
MARIKLSRRTLLKGAGGIAMALPLLEAMMDGREALAQAVTPRRYIVCFGGQSMGADGDPVHNVFAPTTVGPNYDLKTGTQPLQSVKDDVSIISDLSIPRPYDVGGTTVPAGGARDDFHVSSLSPLLSGVRADDNTYSRGVTSDQVIAKEIAGNTTFPSLIYRVQAEWYLQVSAPYGRESISYKADAQGNPQQIQPVVSPRQAYQQLFGSFTPPNVDPAAAAAANRQLRMRKSVVDLVKGDTQTLIPKLGKADQVRIQRHLDELRDLETRIDAIPPVQSGICQPPSDPGADPALGGNQGDTYDQNLGYSGEDQRAQVFADLIHMAMACDLTRVASLQYTMFQSHMSMYQPIGIPNDLHEIGHSGAGTAGMAQAHAWHMKHWAYLINKLKGTAEGSGTMLDNTALVFLFEGGHGYDPSSGKQYSSHSTERMIALCAGRAGGLKPGKHIVATGKHPANVIVSAMKAAGYSGNSLGEVTGDLPELFA